VTEREATLLLVKSDEQAVFGLYHSDFYFSEIKKTPVRESGLAGPFVEHEPLLSIPSVGPGDAGL
jgi:hypothetical protein